jgi:hypothetical protein
MICLVPRERFHDIENEISVNSVELVRRFISKAENATVFFEDIMFKNLKNLRTFENNG